MATVTIQLRDTGPPDTIVLEELTPQARALAEAIAQTSLKNRGDIWMESAALERRPWRGWAHYPKSSSLSPVRYLETEASKIPPDWHVLSGVHPDTPVPSVKAATTDRHLDRRGALAYLTGLGVPVSPAGWETLRGAGHWPDPDRYVCGRAQWRTGTLDAYLARDVEWWTVSRIASYLGYTGGSATGSARKQLSRWGLLPLGRAPGRGGESLYAADQIIAAHTHRPGSGRRGVQRDGGQFTMQGPDTSS